MKDFLKWFNENQDKVWGSVALSEIRKVFYIIFFNRIQLMPDERRALQTKQKKKTCNPFYDETFVYQVSAERQTY